jgi:hypothetical protein
MKSYGGEGSCLGLVVYKQLSRQVFPLNCVKDPCLGGVSFLV